jgi:hypothetical protein
VNNLVHCCWVIFFIFFICSVCFCLHAFMWTLPPLYVSGCGYFFFLSPSVFVVVAFARQQEEKNSVAQKKRIKQKKVKSDKVVLIHVPYNPVCMWFLPRLWLSHHLIFINLRLHIYHFVPDHANAVAVAAHSSLYTLFPRSAFKDEIICSCLFHKRCEFIIETTIKVIINVLLLPQFRV